MPDPARSASVFDAAQEAIEHARRRLFPFDARRWLVLGFVAMLDQCGRGGGSFPNPGSFQGGSGPAPNPQHIIDWIEAHMALLAVAGAAFVVFVVAFAALALWLGSRGAFVYIDDVATGRFDIVRPWHEHAALAGSLFRWRFAISIASFFVTIGVLLLGGWEAIVFIRGGMVVDATFVLIVATLVLMLLAFTIAAQLVTMALHDFVAPIQLAHGVTVGPAIKVLRGLVAAQPLAFALYVVLKIPIHLVTGLGVALAGCLTCCIGFLPVIMQTMLQPLFYFQRAWSLFLLRQMGIDLLAQPDGVLE